MKRKWRSLPIRIVDDHAGSIKTYGSQRMRFICAVLLPAIMAYSIQQVSADEATGMALMDGRLVELVEGKTAKFWTTELLTRMPMSITCEIDYRTKITGHPGKSEKFEPSLEASFSVGQIDGRQVCGTIDVVGWTDLGSQNLLTAATEGDLAQVLTLLEHGAEIDQQDREGLTPLINASGEGHVKIVQALLAEGANINYVSKGPGLTALSWATQFGHADVVNVLLSHGAKVVLQKKMVLSTRQPYIGHQRADLRKLFKLCWPQALRWIIQLINSDGGIP